ncbi:hypothetical protein GHO41_09570 [Pseudomonas sp. FSL R10-0399]|uniref:hypothetical protein n=1 Tax=Pseudomonas sp. FSL R10-0399 TaxID=2662194 RepID=UPI0012960CE3|nr:hypothetical protein [Pseudomonas sp. FSL R10-0399]MQT57588.1 hypothetical protein [Pseudomonas sp. FSL R10-0399]
MCGRFVQYRGIADYLDVLAADRKIVSGYDNHPIGGYNIAPSTRVNILHGVEDGLEPLDRDGIITTASDQGIVVTQFIIEARWCLRRSMRGTGLGGIWIESVLRRWF